MQTFMSEMRHVKRYDVDVVSESTLPMSLLYRRVRYGGGDPAS